MSVEDQAFHQLLHGYRNGHELLGASVKLSAKDAELTARLSDLSGTLQNDTSFYPYLTVYPLTSGDFYAVARTWLDLEAPRAGCVLTRTILLPMRDWVSGGVDVSSIAGLLKRPSRTDISAYSKRVPLLVRAVQSFHANMPLTDIEDFASRYFGEGIRPIVWLCDRDPEPTLIAVIGVLWPDLRERFAGCTLSLQQRTLPSGAFDLLFAPINSYSRFSKVSRENIIASDSSRLQRRIEPWIERLSHVIAGADQPPGLRDWPDIELALGPEPTAIRWLYLLNDLRERSLESPTAALGAMDIVETLCPEPNSKRPIKNSVAQAAIEAANRVVDDTESFKLLQLVSERLTHEAFHSVDREITDELTKRLERKSLENFAGALAAYEGLLAKSSESSDALAIHRRALGRASVLLAGSNPTELSLLRRYDAAAADIVPRLPAVAKGYLNAMDDRILAARDISRWLRSSLYRVNWLGMAQALFPVADDMRDDQLLREIGTNLTPSDVPLVLERTPADRSLSVATAGAITNVLIPKNPDAVRAWALSTATTSKSTAVIAAATFERSQEGLASLLDEVSPLPDAVRDAVAVAFFDTVTHRSFPDWLRTSFAHDSRAARVLWDAARRQAEGAGRVVDRLVPELDLIASDALLPAREFARDTAGSPLHRDLCGLIVRSGLTWLLKGALDAHTLETVVEAPDISRWISGEGGSVFANALALEMRTNPSARTRGWLWLAMAPEVLYRGRPPVSISVAYQLLRDTRAWPTEVSYAWEAVLRRAQLLSEFRFYLRHCVQVVEFAFKNLHLPLGSVVRAAFPTIYKAVMEQSSFASEAESLFSYDWDRGTALRRNLVDAFVRSSWPPGDLAIIAAETFGLRKLFKRVSRKWGGESYLSQMASELSARNDPYARKCANELLTLFRNPNFAEPWD